MNTLEFDRVYRYSELERDITVLRKELHEMKEMIAEIHYTNCSPVDKEKAESHWHPRF